MTPLEREVLHASCRRLSGHGQERPADLLAAAALWCQARDERFDQYGEGEVIEAFEAHIANLLEYEAGRFMPSGTMAQNIALRVWSERAGCRHVAMHPTAHVELHEAHSYAELHGLRATLLGPRDSPLLAEHLDALDAPIAALLFELPIREAGGQLPTWAQLEALKATARQRGTPLHLDGARLWECEPAYGRALHEITAGIDSCYVSFYKGIGGLSGAMLLGDRAFIDEASVWQRRCGGTLYTQIASVATAAMRFDARRAAMPLWLQKTRDIAAKIGEIEGIQVLPDPPQTSMFHVVLSIDPARAEAARDHVAKTRSLWLFRGVTPGSTPDTTRFEVSIGEAAMALEVSEVSEAFEALMQFAG